MVVRSVGFGACSSYLMWFLFTLWDVGLVGRFDSCYKSTEDWQVTLVESMRKRCVFLEHAVNLAGVSNVEVVNGRVEDIGNDSCFREHFDVAVARAVAEMRVLAEYCLPLVRVGGLFVAAKGHNPEDEVKNAETAIRSMGASLLQVCPVESHGPYGQRTAIICLKGHPTPRKYPRPPGTPAKEPL
ncbi:hypothetical protein EUGRSUZ_B00339 [Eucalyptus grandis]|uniref:Ribosomal RNA methyltransferase FtsJ domain-containing protein n=2 Tax=Eucalyptus grandis TaxID=71139 RepID=A0A059CZM9_EUCGR|nr:hypothetical protein EUGRSUZ_B00339 [Eucalyptus grandis]